MPCQMKRYATWASFDFHRMKEAFSATLEERAVAL